jgi:hypothetical protein
MGRDGPKQHINEICGLKIQYLADVLTAGTSSILLLGQQSFPA